jgi:hypothetical protein
MNLVPIGRRPVDIEDPLTWPDSLGKLLLSFKDVLSAFESRQIAIAGVPGERLLHQRTSLRRRGRM